MKPATREAIAWAAGCLAGAAWASWCNSYWTEMRVAIARASGQLEGFRRGLDLADQRAVTPGDRRVPRGGRRYRQPARDEWPYRRRH